MMAGRVSDGTGGRRGYGRGVCPETQRVRSGFCQCAVRRARAGHTGRGPRRGARGVRMRDGGCWGRAGAKRNAGAGGERVSTLLESIQLKTFFDLQYGAVPPCWLLHATPRPSASRQNAIQPRAAPQAQPAPTAREPRAPPGPHALSSVGFASCLSIHRFLFSQHQLCASTRAVRLLQLHALRTLLLLLRKVAAAPRRAALRAAAGPHE